MSEGPPIDGGQSPGKVPLTPTLSRSDGEREITSGIQDAVENHDACWQNIGVYGEGSCRELQKFVHCRNCPVYSHAALRLLERPLPEHYRADWTAHFAKEQR